MAARRIIAVVGATGQQGSGLVKAILADASGGFAARAITRDPGSDKAKALARLGAEVVAGDVDDEESLKKAFAGAYGAYCVTFFWAHLSPEKEMAQAAAMARAARAAGVEHVIWSTLEDSRQWIPLSDNRMPTLMGRYKVPHVDGKGEADAAFAGLPTTYLLASFYWENFIFVGMGPRKGPDGVLGLALPLGDKKFPGIASDDIGACAHGIFKAGDAYIGTRVGIAGEHLTGAEMAEAFTRALGQTVRYTAVDPAVYRGLGFPGAEDLGNMFQFNRDFADDFCAARSLAFSRRMNPGLKTFSAWLAENKGRIPLE